MVWVSITIDIPHVTPVHQGQAIGIDLGIRRLATCSDGRVFENQKHLKAALRKVKRLQRRIARKVLGSHNRAKAIIELARAHFQVHCKRQDAIHKMTTKIARSASVIELEDLNVTGMLQNHRIALAISDASFYEIARQITYKAAWKGGVTVLIDRFYPSSQRCNACGYRNTTLTLKDDTWHCPCCGMTIDRDLNAACNIRDQALQLIAASR